MTDATIRREVDEATRAKWDERFRAVEWTLLPNPALKPRHQNAMDEVLLEEMAAGRRGPHLRFWNWASKAIIIGRGGSRLKEVGATARRGIEELLGQRVYLDLHVKVAKDWQRDPKQLQRLGF